jgi:transcriptional regulator with XRE-family HTH domain
MQLRDIVAINVRRKRNSLKASQLTIALRAQVDTKTYGDLERGNGNPTLETVEAVAVALGLDPLDLFVDPHSGSQ